MITEKELREAIAECQGARNPNANTCIKLAAYYTILDNMHPQEPNQAGASFAPPPDRILYEGNTDFARAVNGLTAEKVLPIMDELMTAVSVIHPRLYASTLRRLAE